MIPKIIHYCWFGGNEMPDLAKKCMKSWKKYCKGYEIKAWNEDTFDISSAPLYVRQAYESKKWAFVTDYVRLWAMTKFGGIYMDTDVEVVAPLDKFLSHQAFSGFESDIAVPTGIMACEKDFPMFKKFLKHYDTAKFINDDGSLNMTTNVKLITDECEEKGLVLNNTYQVIDGFALYPNEYFCPINMTSDQYQRTDNTATIHWFNASWVTEDLREAHYEFRKHNKKRNELYLKKQSRYKKKQRKHKIAQFLRKIIGDKPYTKIRENISKIR